jgi:cytochrome c1
MNKKDEKITKEIMKKYSSLLEDLGNEVDKKCTYPNNDGGHSWSFNKDIIDNIEWNYDNFTVKETCNECGTTRIANYAFVGDSTHYGEPYPFDNIEVDEA